MKRKDVNFEKIEEDFKSDIYTMMLALGATENVAVQVIADNKTKIKGWIEPKGTGTTIPAARAARILIDDGEILKNGKSKKQ